MPVDAGGVPGGGRGREVLQAEREPATTRAVIGVYADCHRGTGGGRVVTTGRKRVYTLAVAAAWIGEILDVQPDIRVVGHVKGEVAIPYPVVSVIDNNRTEQHGVSANRHRVGALIPALTTVAAGVNEPRVSHAPRQHSGRVVYTEGQLAAADPTVRIEPDRGSPGYGPLRGRGRVAALVGVAARGDEPLDPYLRPGGRFGLRRRQGRDSPYG